MIRILATGFGSFPGARSNPSSALLAALRRKRQRFARLGIDLELYALPVIYKDLGPRLAELALASRPDAILHFGLASRRRIVSIETRARNHASLLHADAEGAYPDCSRVLADGPEIIRARMPLQQIASAVRRAGIASGLSADAGDYLCNAVLYYSLAAPHALTVGFIHIPHPRVRMPCREGERPRRPSLSDIVMAAEIALVAIATAARGRTSLKACVTPGSASRVPS